MLVVFIACSMFFVIKLHRAIIPDEPKHLTLSVHFATTLGIPADVPETYALGFIAHRPFLYYWLNGRVLNAVELFIPDLSDRRQLVILRLVGTLYSTLSVIFCYLLSKEIFADRWWQILPPFLLTNTLMFVFLSGGVQYDNLTNLCVSAGIYFLMRVLNGKPFYENSLYWLLSMSAGGLTERKALPVALISVMIWFWFIMKNRSQIDFRPKWSWYWMSLTAVVIFLFALNFSIWGINLIKYQAFKPACIEILTEVQCQHSPIERRNKILRLPEKLTFQDIIAGDYPDPLRYFTDYWTFSMLKRIYGIMGHKAYFPNLTITFFRLLIIWIVFTAIRYWKLPSYQIGCLTVLFIFHTIVLLEKNYSDELVTGFRHVAIQGRYIFPVIGAAYVVMVYYISQIQNSILRRVTVLYTILIFLWGGALFLLIDLPSDLAGWFY
jgi:hypothetical protein